MWGGGGVREACDFYAEEGEGGPAGYGPGTVEVLEQDRRAR